MCYDTGSNTAPNSERTKCSETLMTLDNYLDNLLKNVEKAEKAWGYSPYKGENIPRGDGLNTGLRDHEVQGDAQERRHKIMARFLGLESTTPITTNESVQIIGGLHDYAVCVPKPKWIEPAHYMSFELEREGKKMSNIPKIPFTVTVNGGTPTFTGTFKLEDLYTSMQYVKNTWPDAEMRLFGIPFVTVPAIDDVIFNGPATIVMWADGDKTVVKCQDGDTFSKETGLAMAIAKKALGNKGRFNETFKKWIPEYGKSDD